MCAPPSPSIPRASPPFAALAACTAAASAAARASCAWWSQNVVFGLPLRFWLSGWARQAPGLRTPPAVDPARAALPDSGLSLVELEAAAGAGPKKRLPRELRNLALPDREWHVAVPFFTTGSKTREQFSSSADMQAAAAAARDMHSRRVAEAEAAAEEAELRLDLEAEESRPEHRRGAGAS